MMDLKELLHLPRASTPSCAVNAKSARAGGLVVLVLGLIGLYLMLPEIRRYLRMERM